MVFAFIKYERRHQPVKIAATRSILQLEIPQNADTERRPWSPQKQGFAPCLRHSPDPLLRRGTRFNRLTSGEHWK